MKPRHIIVIAAAAICGVLLGLALVKRQKQSPAATVATAPFAVMNPTPHRHTNLNALLPDDPVQLLNYGTELLHMGRYPEAVQLYSKALKINPEDEEAHFNLGVAYAKMGRTNDAMHHYEDALKIFPDYPEAHNNLGNILVAQGKTAEGVQHYYLALKAQPEYTSAMNN